MPSRAALMQGSRPSELIVVRNKEIMKKRRAVQEPVIIYVESPKVIHAHPSEFRSVVQRLTGAAAPSSSSIPDDATASAHHHLPPQFFPSQQQLIYGLISANKQCDDMGKDCTLPFVTSTMSPSSVYSYLPGGGGGSTSLINSFFSTSSDHQLLISPSSFLFEDQNMAPPAVTCPTSSLLLPPSSIIGGDNHGNNRFIDQL
ncbi:hypothetical protein QOZ80_4AG0298680 [Eleusine coracana subsp. coracana]|nr:hypothetical protein QOZ80_4AG0298680 [Eleusine coracana subsp. coracana]